jgi:hypothetical protein
MLKRNFQSACLPAQDRSFDESLTLWKGCLSFKQYIPLKVAKFSLKTFELCESCSRYLWNFFVYTGADNDITTSIGVLDSPQSSMIVIRLVESVVKLGIYCG